MNKLTAEKCREMFLRLFDEKRQDGITLKEDLYLQALEIALPVLERKERGEGWIEWRGGEQPVADNTIVDVRLRNGQVRFLVSSDSFIWTNGYSDLPETAVDIIAYRVVKQSSGKHQEGE